MYSRALQRTVLACLGVLASPTTPWAQSANWFALDANSTASTIEVDVSSLRWRGERRELRVRMSYEQAQLHPDGGLYRSVLATLEVNCENGQALWHSASFYPDPKAEHSPIKGEHYSAGLPAINAQASISERTWATLRRSACVQPPSTVP